MDTEENKIQTLSDKFSEAQNLVTDIQENPIRSDDRLEKAKELLEDLTRMVSLLGLFSMNETMEDVSTDSVKYLLLPSYLGCIVGQIFPAGEDRHRKRIDNLLCSEAYYKDFLKRMNAYGLKTAEKIPEALLDEEFCTQIDSSSHTSRRKTKVETYEKIQKLKKKLKEIEKRMRVCGDDNSDIEEQLRELYLNKLKLHVIESIEQCNLVIEERVMLENMIKRKHDARCGPSVEPAKKEKKAISSFVVPVRIIPVEVRDKVFGPGYPSLPKYSVEEYYDMLERGGKLPVSNDAPELDKDEQDAIEDHEQDIDAAAYLKKKRDWDEFKDDNPRGSGNRHNKG